MFKKKRLLKIIGIGFLVLIVVGGGLGVYVAKNWPYHSYVDPAKIQYRAPTGDRTRDAINRAVDFLKAHQEADGNFVLGDLAPRAAWTALAVDALMKCPDQYTPQEHPFIQQALDAVAAACKGDGGIYSPIPVMPFGNYSTSLSIVALKTSKLKKYDDIIAAAVGFLRKCQHRGEADDDNNGGVTYDPGKGKADNNNTVVMLEALAAAGVPKDDPAYRAAIEFVTRTQNNPETNPRMSGVGSDGGIIYGIDRSPAGTRQDESGKTYHASYGAMTYAGLISFLYADVGKDDPRVKSAWKWISHNYDLHENVNMKKVGLYYYYRIMAKALQRYGERYVVTPDGVRHDWARELADHLISLQHADGAWRNEDATYFENDPILATSYAIGVLTICYEEMRRYAAQTPAPDESRP